MTTKSQNISGTRITLMLDDDILKKLRENQAKLIMEKEKSVSFSRVINEIVLKSQIILGLNL